MSGNGGSARLVGSSRVRSGGDRGVLWLGGVELSRVESVLDHLSGVLLV